MGADRKIKKHGEITEGRNKAYDVSWRIILRDIAFTGIIAWLFYDSVWGILLFPAVCVVYKRLYNEDQLREHKAKDQRDFRELLELLLGSMQAGYSFENAFINVQKELSLVLGRDNKLVGAVDEMNRRVSMNMPVEAAFEALATSFDLQECYEFAEIIKIAKRLGGDYNRNIRWAAEKIEDKISLAADIEVMLAEKKLELRIMTIMPLLIMAYIKVASGEIISAMYHNIIGVSAMTICLVLYLVMIKWAKRIVAIEI